MHLDNILEKARREVSLTKEEIIYLLGTEDENDIQLIFAAARDLRERHFGKKIFLYGFVYFSTYCRNNCSFCLFRKSNNVFQRYRKSEKEILQTAIGLADSGVHLLDLTMGEDPEYLEDGPGLEKLLGLVSTVRKETGLPLMISPGVATEESLLALRQAGVDWYACYQETHNRELFAGLRLGQSYDERIHAKIFARKNDFLIEEGLLTGVGDSLEDVADSMQVMHDLGAHQVRVMSFVPQEGTPMAHCSSPVRRRELLIIAVMRLTGAWRLIPASLDVDGIVGLKERLDAGANVVTSIIPPKSGLAGVSHSILDIDDGNRTVARVAEVLAENRLQMATSDDYQNWITWVRKEGENLREAVI